MDERSRAQVAEALSVAEHDREAMPPISETQTGFTVDDAYEVQWLNVRARIDAGRRIVGYKVGLTSQAIQEMFGADEPDYGHLLDDMVVPDGSTVPAAAYLQPRAEVEIAFVLGETLAGSDVTIDDVLRCTAHVVPAIEIVDSRIADWRVTLADTVADNGSAAGVVLGTTRNPVGDLDLAAVAATLRCNDEVAGTGSGAAAMGHPAASVAWLANKLATIGADLVPGQVVLTGSCTTPRAVAAGDRIEGDLGAIGTVRVAFS